MKILSVAHHRNGISGEPFVVAVYLDPENNDDRFVATIGYRKCERPDHRAKYGECPDGSHLSAERTRVLAIDMLVDGEVAFGRNSWRGDSIGDRLIPLVEVELDRQHDALLADLKALGASTEVEVITLVPSGDRLWKPES